MDVLNKSYVQITASLRAMTPAARLAVALSVVVVAASAVYLARNQVANHDTYLLGGEIFTARQLGAMQTAFGKAGLEAHVEGGRIRVPHGQESKYMAALAESGAIEDFGGHLKKAVSGNSFMLYGPQQEARTKVALQSELQLVISRMKGIESAFVHVGQEARHGFREKSVVTASVAVQPQPNHSLDEATVAAIRSLVASAWIHLTPEAITVVDLSGPRLFAGTSGEQQSQSPLGSYAQAKKRLEADWQEKIARLLAPMVAGALVTTNVDFGDQAAADAKLVPRRVTVSVAIPSTHYEAIWDKRHAPAGRAHQYRRWAAELAEIETAEKKKILAAISPLLGSQQGTADSSQVAITTFYPPGASQSSEPQPPADGWLRHHWGFASLVGLALVGLAALWSMSRPAAVRHRGSASQPEPFAAEAPLVPQPDRSPDDANVRPTERSRGRAGVAASLRDELAHVVRDHPDSAVSLLRTWIGNAS